MDLQELLKLMVSRGASDLHIKAASPPVLRVDGELLPLEAHPPLAPAEIAAALGAIATPELLQRFQASRELDFAYSLAGVARFRVNAAFQRGSVGLSFRLIPVNVPGLEVLGLPAICQSLATRRNGLVLVTGPTGSGKSTTLAAMIDYINANERRRIVTIEDPIEYLHRDKRSFLTQREIGGDTRDFAVALRAALRQDPDVILVGEMRDLETIATAITAAETGHLVLGTLHTMGAAQTVDRIINVFPPAQQQQIRVEASLCLEAVISQTLLPKLEGKGRVAAVEVMVATGAVRNLMREAKTHQLPNSIAMGSQFGMQTLDQHLRALVAAKKVSMDEALLRASNPDELRRLLNSPQPSALSREIHENSV
ncbi:MAG: type IV pilus twitching motility protein PilT [Chloroflexi bacterium]|nr:type IV pilus twitching motility protein PilT [Chloroflexota bacterium]